MLHQRIIRARILGFGCLVITINRRELLAGFMDREYREETLVLKSCKSRVVGLEVHEKQ